MTSPANESGGPSLPPELAREVNDLLSGLCDELLDEHDVRRLGALISADDAVRRYYLRFIAVHSTLVTAAGSYSSPMHVGEEPAPIPPYDGNGAKAHDGDERETAPRPAAPGRFSRRTWLTAAAFLISLGVGIWALRGGEDAPEHALSPVAGRTGGVEEPEPGALPLVAEITYASPAARWQSSNDSYALTSRVRSGQTLALELGTVELTYASGTTVLLTGPSEFVVDGNGGSLQRGEIVARVTKAGHGFTIVTPHGKIIDRGTEFGVVVDDFGVSEVNVFEGRVEAFPVGGAGPLAEKIDLTTGRTLQWSGDSIISMNAGQRNIRPRLPAAFASSLDAATPTVLLDWRLDSDSFDQQNWTALGAVRPTRDGLLLDGASSATERPYVITTREFDPSLGPLIITCDVRFGRLGDNNNTAFSILTRCANERGKPATPWHDMLASCVRCSLKADARSGEGMLEAGAKYEHDRELSKISWRGFARPQPEVTYHLEMRDDGLNVSFTATLADNPSVRKTVTCRSLFRGARNFIAFEGFSEGQETVSNVRISQNRVADAPEYQIVQSAETSGARSLADPATADRLLKTLIPRDATVRLSEDFDSEELDADLWTTLGDVAIQDGQLELGAANPEQHIDTWRQRPYLLTRETFTPSSRALTIVGRASFAPNFLHGYGGSFAVMTRAEARYGAGPGWEQSALRRGIRANLWPAALGQDRSLELFEMLAPDPIKLLASADFPIDPAARAYLFCVTDDGASATLTFIDAANPAVRKTLSHATESPLLTRGHIAFEGCWGAPVHLDELRIYESPASKPLETTPED